MTDSVLIVIIVNILRVMLLKKVMDLFLRADDEERKRVNIGLFAYYLLTTIMYSIFEVSALYEVCNYLGMIGLTALYQEIWKKRIWVSLLLFGMDMACSLAVFLVFAEEGRLQQPAMQVLLLLICVTVIEHVFHQQNGEKLLSDETEMVFDKKQTYILIVIPATSVCILSILWYGGFQGKMALLICICMLLVNLSVFYLYHVLLENYIKLRENEMYKQQTYAYQNQLEVIMESQNRIRSLRHDMKNHILALRVLSQKNNTEEVRKYLDSMEHFMENPLEYVATGNDTVDSLLNYKIQKAKDVLYDVETQIHIPEKLNLHSFDLNVVLGNLLDNAIDAAMVTEEKKLRIVMKLDKGVLFLNICNSCQGISDGRKKDLETTKTDRLHHGIGLKNVRRIVEKYHGEMDLLCENNCMEVDIMMYIKGM